MKQQALSEAIALYIMSCSTDELTQLTRSGLAEKFDIHQNYLSRRFREDFDLTILGFIDLEKVVRARILIAGEQRMTVEQLASEVGIAKPQQFRAKFRKIFRTTPGRFMHCANQGD